MQPVTSPLRESQKVVFRIQKKVADDEQLSTFGGLWKRTRHIVCIEMG